MQAFWQSVRAGDSEAGRVFMPGQRGRCNLGRLPRLGKRRTSTLTHRGRRVQRKISIVKISRARVPCRWRNQVWRHHDCG